jgi:hypothetical protein
MKKRIFRLLQKIKNPAFKSAKGGQAAGLTRTP